MRHYKLSSEPSSFGSASAFLPLQKNYRLRNAGPDLYIAHFTVRTFSPSVRQKLPIPLLLVNRSWITISDSASNPEDPSINCGSGAHPCKSVLSYVKQYHINKTNPGIILYLGNGLRCNFFYPETFFISTDMEILFFAIAAALNDRLLFVHLFFLAQSTWTLSSLGRLTGQSVLLSSVR